MWALTYVGTAMVIGAALLVGALLWLTRVRETFIDIPQIPDLDLATIPEPQKLMKQVRTLLDKYDKPEVWNHAAQVMDKDPGQLARLNLGIMN